MTSPVTPRERDTGRYAPRADRPCRCGHPLGSHTAERLAGEQPCLADDCDCPCYTRAPRRPAMAVPGHRQCEATVYRRTTGGRSILCTARQCARSAVAIRGAHVYCRQHANLISDTE